MKLIFYICIENNILYHGNTQTIIYNGEGAHS